MQLPFFRLSAPSPRLTSVTRWAMSSENDEQQLPASREEQEAALGDIDATSEALQSEVLSVHSAVFLNLCYA